MSSLNRGILAVTFCYHTVMAATTELRKLLGVRATTQEHRLLLAAAKRQHRSLNSFVLRAALDEARRGRERRSIERTPEAIEAALRHAQELMRPHRQKGRRTSEELIAERRAEAAREQ